VIDSLSRYNTLTGGVPELTEVWRLSLVIERGWRRRTLVVSSPDGQNDNGCHHVQLIWGSTNGERITELDDEEDHEIEE